MGIATSYAAQSWSSFSEANSFGYLGLILNWIVPKSQLPGLAVLVVHQDPSQNWELSKLNHDSVPWEHRSMSDVREVLQSHLWTVAW